MPELTTLINEVGGTNIQSKQVRVLQCES